MNQLIVKISVGPKGSQRQHRHGSKTLRLPYHPPVLPVGRRQQLPLRCKPIGEDQQPGQKRQRLFQHPSADKRIGIAPHRHASGRISLPSLNQKRLPKGKRIRIYKLIVIDHLSRIHPKSRPNAVHTVPGLHHIDLHKSSSGIINYQKTMSLHHNHLYSLARGNRI